MRVTWGTTRYVILIGPIAIKIVRTRPLWVLLKIVDYYIHGTPSPRLCEYSDSPIRSGFTHLFAGILANRHEYSSMEGISVSLPSAHPLVVSVPD